jgi:gelsolin
MPPNQGLVHLKEYDIKDSNVELIGTDIDHKVKYNSAVTEPAWNNGKIGLAAGLFVWRIEEFIVVPWPTNQTGTFYDGDSYIILNSYKVGDKDGQEKLCHSIFFWLGEHTSQDEAGTAAYKTVELDEFLHGKATQHREIQASPSDEFLALFPRLTIRSGGVKSGFRHVEEKVPEKRLTLLRVFHQGSSVVVLEVEPTWHSLDEHDVYVLDVGDKIWVWQGKSCSPMEKAKAAQVVHDMTLAKHIDVEVLAQAESRSRVVVKLLGVTDDDYPAKFEQSRPIAKRQLQKADESSAAKRKKLFRLSDSSGSLRFDLVNDGPQVSARDLDGNDVFLFDNAGKAIWVWEGQGASRAEKKAWLKVAQTYVHQLSTEGGVSDAHLTPIAKVIQGNESPAFMKAITVA